LPAPNPFIPDDFTIKQPTEKFTSTVPILLRSDNKMKLWFKQDTTFKLPRAVLNFEINSPVAYESPAAVVMSKLFCKLLTDSLNEYVFITIDIAGVINHVHLDMRMMPTLQVSATLLATQSKAWR